MSSIQDVLVCVSTYVQRKDLNVEAAEPIEEVLTEYVPGKRAVSVFYSSWAQGSQTVIH